MLLFQGFHCRGSATTPHFKIYHLASRVPHAGGLPPPPTQTKLLHLFSITMGVPSVLNITSELILPVQLTICQGLVVASLHLIYDLHWYILIGTTYCKFLDIQQTHCCSSVFVWSVNLVFVLQKVLVSLITEQETQGFPTFCTARVFCGVISLSFFYS